MTHHAATVPHAGSADRRPWAFRRILTALAVLVLVVTGLVVPTPQPAHAGLYNLFPADFDGFPKGHFYSDEALYVTMTSDFKGGVVCIVSAAITDPSRANCVNNLAWGKEHTYVGLGTLLGYPLAAPRLQPGKWRLLTVPQLETVETVPVVKNVVLEQMKISRPTPGTELSEEFVVEPCDPCDESWARDELQTWKNTARTIAPSAASVKVQKAIGVASKVYKVAAGMYAGASGGLAGILLGGLAGAGVFQFAVSIPSTNDLAKQLYKDLATKTQSMFAGIAADPPDFDYADVAPPALESVPETGNPLLDRYFQALSDAAAYGDASRIANERYQGAVIDGDHEAAYRQAQAASDYTGELVSRLRLIRLWQDDVATFDLDYDGPELSPGEKHLGAEPYFFDSFADVDDVDAYWADVLADLDDIAANGVTDVQRDQIDGLTGCDRSAPQPTAECGTSDGLIAAALATAQDAEFIAGLAGIDVHRTIGDFLQDQLPLYTDLIENFTSFGNWMAHQAADEYRQTDLGAPNRPPASAFTASASTGAAPLTVTFTSQVSDPDDDDLSLHWDLAGARHVYDEMSVTHTFTNPGTYWIGLTATDPDGLWDQAVQKIEVYPGDGSGPGGQEPDGNRAPIADFAPRNPVIDGPYEPTFGQTFTAVGTDDEPLSFDPDDDPLTYTWYFGDGTSYTGETITKQFDQGLIMTVVLVVSDGWKSAQAVGEVTANWADGVPPGANHPPVASFTADPDSGNAPLDVLFTSTATDEDEDDVLTYRWDFGDGQGDIGKKIVAHTYTQPGSYVVTLTVSDGQAAHTATQVVTVAGAPAPLQAAFTVGKGYDAASALNGAAVLDTGIDQHPSYPVTNIVLPSTFWRTPNSVTDEQSIVVKLAGGGRDLLDRVVLTGANSTASVKTFSVALTQGDNPFGGYATVIDRQELAPSAVAQTFTFAPQTATFLRLTVHDNHGAGYLRLDRLAAPTAGRDGGIVSLAAGVPAAIVSASSQYSAAYSADKILLPNNSYWSTPIGVIADQTIRLRLGGDGPHLVDRVALRGYNTTTTRMVRDFEVWASDTGADGTFTEIGSGSLAQNTSLQEFAVTPTSANYIELRLKNNYGDVNYLYLSELRVLAADGLNVADGAGVGAQVVDASSHYSTDVPENALAPDAGGGRWRGATGQVTDQYLTVLLRGGDLATVDRVVITPGSYRPKSVQVQVSVDGAAFTTVAARQLLNLADDQTITFPPVAARFVKLVIEDGYHATYVGVQRFRVFAVDRGSGDAVSFTGISTGSPESWSWDFGDGGSSTEQHPVHTFPGPGSYDVTLTVTDAGGDADTVMGSYTVPALPTLGIDAASSTVNESANVPLTATTDGSPILQSDWDLGYTRLGTTGAAVTAHFPDNGSYTAQVRGLTADWLWTGPATREFTVLNVAPTVNAGNAASGLAGDPVTPGSATVSDPAGAADPLTCTWDWGDGTAVDTVTDCTSTKTRVPHTYALPGVYTATLTADDGDGGVTSDTVTLTALIRATFLQVTQASAGGDDLVVSVRLIDTASGAGVPGADLQIAADGGAAQTATTDADGYATVTLPGDSGADSVTGAFAGTGLHSASSLTRAVRAPKADIVFVVDESGSMAGKQAAIIANLQTIAQGLGASLDYRLGVVGYAGTDQGSRTFGHVHTALTGDVSEFYRGSKDLVATNGYANGYEGIVVGSGYTVRDNSPDGDLIGSGQMTFRATAASCLVLVSDALSNEAIGSTPRATRDHAEQALASRGTTVFALTNKDQATQDAYGPGVGLAGQTGGDWWDVEDFAKNPADVLTALVTKCITKASTPDLAVSIDAPGTVDGSAAFTATVTASNVSFIDTPHVTFTATLPAGLTFASASDAGVFDADTGTVTWPVVGLLDAGTHVDRTITAHRDTTGLASGDYPSTIAATVGYNGSLGDEATLVNNVATHVVTVQVPEPEPEPEPDSGDIGIGTDIDPAHAPEAGDEFSYPLDVTYTGTGIASNVVLLQRVPDRLSVEDIVIPDGWTNMHDDVLVGAHPDGKTPGTWIYLTADSVDPNDAPQIGVTSTVAPLVLPAVIDDAGDLDDANLPPVVAAPPSTIVSQACVYAVQGDATTDDCTDVEIPVKDIVANVTVRLHGGITYLIVSVAVTESLDGLPITLTWSPGGGDSTEQPRDENDGAAGDLPEDVVIEDLQPGRNYVIPWPGGQIGEDGSAIGWPGWRLITDEDRNGAGELLDPVTGEVLTAEQLAEIVRGDWILDLSQPDAAWRESSTLTFSVNPSIAFAVDYREMLPAADADVDPPAAPADGAGVAVGDPGGSGEPVPAAPVSPSSQPPSPDGVGGEVEVEGVSETAPTAGAPNVTQAVAAEPLAATGVRWFGGLIGGGMLLILAGWLVLLRERRQRGIRSSPGAR